MCNVLGMWRCVLCEQDTAPIHVMVVANRILELAICNLNLLHRAVPAGMDIIELKPIGTSQIFYILFVNVWVCGEVCMHKIRRIFMPDLHPTYKPGPPHEPRAH